MTNNELPEKVGRPVLAFRAFAWPVGRPPWSEAELLKNWRALRREEGVRKVVKKPSAGQICASPCCNRVVALNSKSGVCSAHIHSMHCRCASCGEKRK